mmetsp:Transcript_52933/g.86548  ORF Transcript_52933/g.86548 Transcript_52933/m.86548 type:complete len:80 (+) Transcript_52933:3360-3599(+)
MGLWSASCTMHDRLSVTCEIFCSVIDFFARDCSYHMVAFVFCNIWRQNCILRAQQVVKKPTSLSFTGRSAREQADGLMD